MKREVRHLLVLFLCLGLAMMACSHAETVAPANAPSTPDKPTRLPSARAVTPETEPGHPDLAGSPGQLMAPGSSEAIADALRKRGFLAADASSSADLEKALRAFQDSQGLAATGFPDHETLRKLGINPRAVDTTAKAPDAGK
jgi:peptidoglycan hydrolase-like protein with peptidoglycan-binding domain